MPDDAVTPPWPFNIEDPVRAVHFATCRDCPYGNPTHCPNETRTRKAIEAFVTWMEYPRGSH